MPSILTASVLLVESDAKTGASIEAFLRGRKHRVDWVRDGETAFNRLDAQPFDAMVATMRPRGADIMRLLPVAQERNPGLCVVLLAEARDVPLAIEAMRAGAYDFQTKPVTIEKIETVILRGLEAQRQARELLDARRRLDERFGLAGLLGHSRRMAQVYGAVRQIAPGEQPVLIFGEPGTGKERIAQALHNNSPRRDEPFVKVDCARVSEPITRAELFGQSGTAQARARRGYFEMADRGTLFIEGLAACARTLQEDVLRVLREHAVRREGDDKRIPVDVRVIVAVEQRPYAAAGRARVELFERLSNVTIEAPPLRARTEDLPILAGEILNRANAQYGKQIAGLTRPALDILMEYAWPGNVRELENTIMGMVSTASGAGLLDVRDIPGTLRKQASAGVEEVRLPVGSSLADFERAAIQATLRHCNQDKVACAKMLGIGLRTLYRKLEAFK